MSTITTPESGVGTSNSRVENRATSVMLAPTPTPVPPQSPGSTQSSATAGGSQKHSPSSVSSSDSVTPPSVGTASPVGFSAAPVSAPSGVAQYVAPDSPKARGIVPRGTEVHLSPRTRRPIERSRSAPGAITDLNKEMVEDRPLSR